MTKIAYVPKNFRPATMGMIYHAVDIIEEFENSGYSLTLRQLYYQFVSRDLLPNKQSEYKRLGSVINDARLAGLISWDSIEDRTRSLRELSTWASPAEILDSAARSFRIDLWENQPSYIEVWIEKDALLGVIEGVCNQYRVPYFACRGNASQSEIWKAGQRLAEKINQGKNVLVLHLGDHDPSGIDMTRDNDDRLKMFIDRDADVGMFELERIALNMDQIKKYAPPPNPAKETDSRYSGYAALHGTKSWELDALNPKVISTLISSNVQSRIDYQAWAADEEQEQEYTARLKKMSKEFKS